MNFSFLSDETKLGPRRTMVKSSKDSQAPLLTVLSIIFVGSTAEQSSQPRLIQIKALKWIFLHF